MADAITVFTAIGITILMILMVVSGIAIIIKDSAGPLVAMKSVKYHQILTIIRHIGVFLYIPGTIILYAVYIKSLIVKS
ncbi:IMV protein VP13 [Yokapox virus]|uniref:IMV protein VP13 n=1 Tax=Yokapox virus TaxID=1076255 RepID=G3EID1_9POXV|nr:IMV protein VP13 [Yokapox virus]AEN03642.1 IMV protein VP13 [Yokapox virus]